MARLGDRVITEREFLERAEYTIRPPYAKMDYYVHKKIILNSLIAEALLARDRGESTELARNERFRLFVQGQKEQAMRQMFYRRHFYEPIKLDPQEVRRVYDLAARTYEIRYLSTKNKAVNDLLVQKVLHEKQPFEETARKFFGIDRLPTRKVEFAGEEIHQVKQALYEQPVKPGQLIGPLQIENEFLWLVVDGWTEKIDLSTQAVQNRSRDVTEHLTFKYAEQAFRSYVVKLMKGKKVEFNPETFVELVNLLGPIYFPPGEQKEIAMKKLVWGKAGGDDLPIDSLSLRLQNWKDRPLLTVDGKVWTIGDLDRELLLHPLHFRKRRMAKNEFAEQLKLALVDIIRDKYITRQAYREGFDKHPYVQQRTAMWRDAYLAEAARNEYLAALGKLEEFPNRFLSIIEQDLNPLIDSLQTKYSPLIEINTDLLETIPLTRIDLFAVYTDQPYAMVVPPFPMLTTDSQLNYGKKLTADKKRSLFKK
ncbi:MAG: hypothetical protein ONB24_14930 [candidate division KSB1 bacterium]|nr:hypothetical protein [candidate division KSB1 bacterium]